MGAIERFTEAARAIGIEPGIRRFPEGTKTAVDAARAVGGDVAQIVKSLGFMADERRGGGGVGCDVAQMWKSLVFIGDERPVIAFTSGANRVDPVKLAGVAGASE